MTYDSVAAVQEKVKFAMQRKIEGVFAWETSGGTYRWLRWFSSSVLAAAF
jgi:GH18 family chitinase